MSFRGNGRKRDPKFVFGSVFMLIVGLLCLLLAANNDWKGSWTTISLVVILLSLFMFKNANEQ